MGGKPCRECDLLVQVLSEAETAWAAARYQLSIRPLGTLEEGEFHRLSASERSSWLEVDLTRRELHRHRAIHHGGEPVKNEW
jgi:hypothetical protein